MTIDTLAGHVLSADGRRVPGWIEIAGGRIVTASTTAAPTATRRLPDGMTVLPGYVDVHVHGGGGHDLTKGDPAAVAGSLEFHRRHGTTTSLASLVTAPIDDLCAAMRSIVAVRAEGDDGFRRQLAGIHLEGPFLAVGRCGAQNPDHMIDPTPAAVDALLDAGGDDLRAITIAPERPGALDAIARFVDAGVTVAIGHTDADHAAAQAAIDAGATLATHLGNAMPPLHHRAAGPIAACLQAESITCELIVDNHHLDPAFVRLVGTVKTADRVALITDAIAAAGAGAGRYVLGVLDVEVRDGVARLVTDDGSPGSLAGSTLTMDAAVRHTVASGLELADASVAASLAPARLIGRGGEIGSIEAGRWADLVIVDRALDVVAVIVGGEVVVGDVALDGQ